MQKNLYSLMLMDSVVREIDKLALQKGTNRSNLVNQILADYVSLMTPEKRIGSIFRQIEDLMNQMSDIVPFAAENAMTMSLKSSLEYKYRPTIRYEVQLYRVPEENGDIGELSVIFRTTSQTLLSDITEFFRLWRRLENVYIAQYFDHEIVYALYDGKLTRSISLPKNADYTNEQIGSAIGEYIKMYDALMKKYLSRAITPIELENEYLSYLKNGVGLI